MSIERNAANRNAFTIKTLSQLNGADIKEYVNVSNGGYDFSAHYFPLNGTFIVRAKVTGSGSGVVFGNIANYPGSTAWNYRLAVMYNDGTLTFYLNNTNLGSKTIDDKPHDFGFLNGYAIFDGQKVDASKAQVTSATKYIFGLCGVTTGSNFVANTNVSIDLYRADITLANSANGNAQLCRFYPVSNGELYNSLKNVFEWGGDPTSASITKGPNVTYGIQLDDLRYITGSRYRDLMAIICDDGGVDERSGLQAEQPYTHTSNGTTHSFAFNLGGVSFPSGTTGAPPYASMKGQLRQGRKPKWDIWNDSVKHGFYIRIDNGTPKLEYNIFKNPDGSDTPIRLEWFENYNTEHAYMGSGATEYSHAPNVVLNQTDVNLEFHNGVFHRCAMDNMVLPYAPAIPDVNLSGVQYYRFSQAAFNYYDHNRIFLLEDYADINTTVKLGNLIPWEIPQAQLGEEYYIYGGGVEFHVFGVKVAEAVTKESTWICKDHVPSGTTLAALKTKYRDTGVSANVELDWLGYGLCKEIKQSSNNTVNGTAKLSLKRNVDTVDASSLYGGATMSFHGTFDPYLDTSHSSHPRRRIFVKEVTDAGDTMKLAFWQELDGIYYRGNNDSSTSNPAIIVLPIAEINTSTNDRILRQVRDYYAVVLVERVGTNGLKSNEGVTLVKASNQSYNTTSYGSTSTPPSNTTKARSIYNYRKKQFDNGANTAHFWTRGSSIINSNDPAYNRNASSFSESNADSQLNEGYERIIAVQETDFLPNTAFVNEEVLESSNVIFYIYRDSYAPMLTRLRGNFTHNLIGMTVSNGVIFFSERWIVNRASSTNILYAYGQKWAVPSSNTQYQLVTEGDDSNPVFNTTVKVFKNNGQNPVAQFSCNKTWTTEKTNSTTGLNYYDQETWTNNGYTLRVSYEMEAHNSLSPNGGIPNVLGVGWYWIIQISGGSSQAGDIYDIQFTN